RVWFVDWEQAGLGPGLIDLAALVAGRWDARERAAIARAYYLARPARERPPEASFLEALAAWRLLLPVQLLGGAPAGAPPSGHPQDWVGEALRLAEGVEA